MKSALAPGNVEEVSLLKFCMRFLFTTSVALVISLIISLIYQYCKSCLNKVPCCVSFSILILLPNVIKRRFIYSLLVKDRVS
jgi:DMSO reductase anchor subunit